MNAAILLVAQIPDPDSAMNYRTIQGTEEYLSALPQHGVLSMAVFLLNVISVAVFAALAYRRFPYRGSFFSALLFLALLPFGIGTLDTYLRLQVIIGMETLAKGGIWDGDWFAGLRGAGRPVEFWGVVCAVQAIVYAMLFGLSQRSWHQSAKAEGRGTLSEPEHRTII